MKRNQKIQTKSRRNEPLTVDQAVKTCKYYKISPDFVMLMVFILLFTCEIYYNYHSNVSNFVLINFHNYL